MIQLQQRMRPQWLLCAATAAAIRASSAMHEDDTIVNSIHSAVSSYDSTANELLQICRFVVGFFDCCCCIVCLVVVIVAAAAAAV